MPPVPVVFEEPVVPSPTLAQVRLGDGSATPYAPQVAMGVSGLGGREKTSGMAGCNGRAACCGVVACGLGACDREKEQDACAQHGRAGRQRAVCTRASLIPEASCCFGSGHA